MSKVKVVQKQGLMNEEGAVIIPLEYESIKILKCGVYVAKLSTLNIEEDKPARSQYYHHKKLIPVKDQCNYHIYTDKGRLIFTEPILNYICDDENDEKIVAVEVPGGWRLVELDYERNILRTYFSTVKNVITVLDGYVVVKRFDGGCTVYSLNNWEKVLDLIEAEDICIVRDEGFIVHEKETRKTGFYNLKGNMLIDYEWDNITYERDYLRVTELWPDKWLVKRRGKYSYDGKELEMIEYDFEKGNG